MKREYNFSKAERGNFTVRRLNCGCPFILMRSSRASLSGSLRGRGESLAMW
jgi:hypothetical protein